MLVYVATIFLYRFTFILHHFGPNGPEPRLNEEREAAWIAIDATVDALFGIDLVANFFFSFRNAWGCEVDDMRLIARNYLTGYFWINLLGCIPDWLGRAIVGLFVADEDGGVSFRVARIARLHRISRLARLLRLHKWLTFKKTHYSLWKSFQRMNGVRMVKFMFGFACTVHILACGWYLCAALHTNVWDTWVARRPVTWGSEETLLLEAPPREQWINSMYFVATVVTTVGFGDISAGTAVEIVYVFMIMLVGAVVHGIVIGEVIRILTSTAEIHTFIQNQLDVAEAFSKHAQLSSSAQAAIKDEIHYRGKDWMIAFDKDRMKELVVGTYLPHHLMATLPCELFGGRLLRNDLLACFVPVPPRVACLLAVCLHPLEFHAGEMAYQRYDTAFNMFLVLHGTFAHVALPTPTGGVDRPCEGHALKDGTVTIHRSGTMLHRARTMLHSKQPGHNHQRSAFSNLCMFPYQLHSFNSYFGEMELLQARPCVSTVRCETSVARALALCRKDLAELKEQFPNFAALWHIAAQRREGARQRQLKRLVSPGLTYRAIAALSIQRHWRRWKRSASGLLPRTSSSRLVEEKHTAVTIEQMKILHSMDSESRPLHNMDPESRHSNEMARMRENMDGLGRNMATLHREMRSMIETLEGIKAQLGDSEDAHHAPSIV